ncbi:MAG: DUF4258 domain-containing protein [Deinococcota bacterium]
MSRYNRIIYTQHALERMSERRISQRQVERTLEQPDKTYPSDGKLVAERVTVHGNTLKVVYSETANGLTITSAIVITVIRISP